MERFSAYAYLVWLCRTTTTSIIGLAGIAATLLLPAPATAQRGIINDPGHHAVFNCLVRTQPDDGTLRLYLDSGGNLYPSATYLPDPLQDIRYDAGVANTQADLQWYFDRHPTQRDALFRDYLVPLPRPQCSTAYDTAAWDTLRTHMARRVAEKINLATDNGAKTLIVLIHGYNVADTAHAPAGTPCGQLPAGSPPRQTAYYAAIRTALCAARPSLGANTIWLEVYWDGLQENATSIWGAGQLSARYAGLALREVLQRVRQEVPMRVFTHSAGGIVISQALWNSDPVDKKYAKQLEEIQLRRMMRAIHTPLNSNIRVGMLVPALSSMAFVRYHERTPSTQQPVEYRIVVGQNIKDFAVSKAFIGSEYFGATSMGADQDAFDFAKSESDATDMRRVDFCITPKNWLGLYTPRLIPRDFQYRVKGFPIAEAHSWPLYFRRQSLVPRPGEPTLIIQQFLAEVLD